MLSQLPATCYPILDPPVALWEEVASNWNHPASFSFVDHELLALMKPPDRRVGESFLCNAFCFLLIRIIRFGRYRNQGLTESFYATRALRYYRRRKLEQDWLRYSDQPPQQQSLLEGALLISCWGQIDQPRWVTLAELNQQFDAIARRVAQVGLTMQL